MPTIQISVYASDSEMIRFLQNKEEISKKSREYIKSLLSEDEIEQVIPGKVYSVGNENE